MFKRKAKKSSIADQITRSIWRTIFWGSLTTGIAKFLFESHKKKQQMATGSGIYGAVAIAKVFKGADFPLSKQDILQKYGDQEIEYHYGKKEKLRDILQDIPDQMYNRTTDLEHALHESIESHKI